MRLKASASSPCLTALASAISASAVAAAYSCTNQAAKSDTCCLLQTERSTLSAISASAVAAAYSCTKQAAKSDTCCLLQTERSTLSAISASAVAAAYSCINQKARSEAVSDMVCCLDSDNGSRSSYKLYKGQAGYVDVAYVSIEQCKLYVHRLLPGQKKSNEQYRSCLFTSTQARHNLNDLARHCSSCVPQPTANMKTCIANSIPCCPRGSTDLSQLVHLVAGHDQVLGTLVQLVTPLL